MNKSMGKIFLNYGVPVVLFFFLSLFYFVPEVLEGKKINQHDILQFKGMSKEISDHRTTYGEEPLWTNSMYAGMPAYLVSTRYSGNLLRIVHRIINLGGFRPVSFIFLYLVGAYIALLLFGLSPWFSFAGAIAYAFSSYFFIVIEAGHVSKVLALGYMPPVIAGVYAAFRGKVLIGSLVTGLFLGLQIFVNHLQITYYTLLIIVILGIFELVNTFRNKTWMAFLKPFPWLILFVLLAVGANFSNLYTTWEYGKDSIRGKSELTSNAENRTSGLDKDYATQWSYGIGETMSLLVPNVMGGSSAGSLSTRSHTYQLISKNYGAGQANKFIDNVPTYWGEQPVTSGPVYVGSVVIFLFLLGLFLVKGQVRWWLLAVSVFSIALAWGHNFPLLTNFMLDHFPGYNKFRTVSMTLVMAEFAMPLLAILALREIAEGTIEKKDFYRALKVAVFGLSGFLLILLAIAGSFDMTAPIDEELRGQGMGTIVDAIQQDRLAMLRGDAFRSLIFVILTAALVYFTYLKKVKFTTLIALAALLFVADLWPVNKRYLNGKDFITSREDKNPFVASVADQLILQDKSPDFKVLNLTVSPLQDASTSYFHKSLGGYHGAKMRRFQELFDYCLQPEIGALIGTLQKNPNPASIDSTFATLGALNMLNTRYVIYNNEAPPLVNKHEQGNAWFVPAVKIVDNADAEIAAVQDFDPAKEAIVDKRFSPEVEGLQLVTDTVATISLTEYRANYLKYKSVTSSEQLAVFSEVYYDKGWQALIDGKPVPHFRANYLLRAMRIPAGEHVVEFRFHPNSYFLGEKVSLASSLLLLLMVAGVAWMEWRKKE